MEVLQTSPLTTWVRRHMRKIRHLQQNQQALIGQLSLFLSLFVQQRHFLDASQLPEDHRLILYGNGQRLSGFYVQPFA